MSCALVGTGKPERSGSPQGGKDAVQQQLEELNREAKEMVAQLKEAFGKLEQALSADPPKDTLIEMHRTRYDDLKAKEARLEMRRMALEAKLPAAGGCTRATVVSGMLCAVWPQTLASITQRHEAQVGPQCEAQYEGGVVARMSLWCQTLSHALRGSWCQRWARVGTGSGLQTVMPGYVRGGR